jgi:DNA-binding GntR family transcriptional regulator
MALSKRPRRPEAGAAKKPQLLTDVVYERLKSEIIQCQLPPGSEVTEGELGDLYSVSKAPLRAALARLAQDGLVRTIPRHGYVIAPVTLKNVQDMYALRLVLEPAVARLATGHVDIALLKRINSDPGGSKSEDAELRFLASNREFHLVIARATGNQRMITIVTQLMDDMARLIHVGLFSSDWRRGAMHGEHKSQTQEHMDLIEALAVGDADGAERAARAHVESSRELVLKAILSQDSLTIGQVPLWTSRG